MPEVGPGIPPQPPSPRNHGNAPQYPLYNQVVRNHKEQLRGQALTVAKLCERELCETLRAAFLGERRLHGQDSLATGVLQNTTNSMRGESYGGAKLEAWIEVCDYVGDNVFRGFIARKGDDRGLFMFMDEHMKTKDLKAGIMAILELAGDESMAITQVVACVDKDMPATDLKKLSHDLGWAGFELTTLESWTDGVYMTSPEWLLLAVEP